VVRGVGVEWRPGAARIGLQAGEHGEVPLQAISFGWQRPRFLAQTSILHAGSRSWGSVYVQRGGPSTQAGVEVVLQPRGVATAVFARRSLRHWGLQSQVITASHGVSSPLAATPRSAQDVGWVHLRARGTWSNRAARIRVAWAQSTWNTADARWRDDLLVQAVKRIGDWTVEMQWRGGREVLRRIDREALGDEDSQRDERLLLRLRLDATPASSFVLERRSRQSHPFALRSTPAQGWRFAWRHGWRATRFDVSLLFFDAVSGESIVFSEPAVGRAPVLFTATSRGMRLALRLRREWRGLQASLRTAVGWQPSAEQPSVVVPPVVEAALRFRTPGRNGF
jgi:hypothetical protein